MQNTGDAAYVVAVEAMLKELDYRDPVTSAKVRRDLGLAQRVRSAVRTDDDGLVEGHPDHSRHPREDHSQHPRFSVIVPVLNEEANIPTLCRRVEQVLASEPYELLIVDDGSTDGSVTAVQAEQERNAAVNLIQLSRNFGHQAALSAGLDHAEGDAVIFMDADLQDPPELLPLLIERWQEGFEVVFAVRRRRRGGVWKRGSYFLFYRLFRRLADIDIALDSGDFALIDREVANALRLLPERNRFLRGLRSWVGFRQIGVEYDRPERLAGAPKYTVRKLVKLAADGILAFSSAPLRLASYLGFLTAMAGVAYLLFAIAGRLRSGAIPQGWTSQIAIELVVGGVNLVMLGIVGEYLARVYEEAKRRPSYIVRDPTKAPDRDRYLPKTPSRMAR